MKNPKVCHLTFFSCWGDSTLKKGLLGKKPSENETVLPSSVTPPKAPSSAIGENLQKAQLQEHKSLVEDSQKVLFRVSCFFLVFLLTANGGILIFLEVGKCFGLSPRLKTSDSRKKNMHRESFLQTQRRLPERVEFSVAVPFGAFC